MIGVIFKYGNDIIKVTVNNDRVYFQHSLTGMTTTTIEGLKLSHGGVIKEFPDLDGRDDWKEEAIKRFKKKIALLPNETERVNYLIQDLKQHGYKPLYKQRQGFRPEKL